MQVVNPTARAIEAQIHIQGFTPRRAQAQVTELAGPLDAVNTAERPEAIVPQRSEWKHALRDGPALRAFPPNSLTILRLERPAVWSHHL